MQVGEIIELGPDGSHALLKYPWLRDQPHARGGWKHNNIIYVAAEQLTLRSKTTGNPGCGTLNHGRKLSLPGAAVSMWHVPDWLNPARGGCGMSYNPLARWGEDGTLRAAARGQEFVAVPKDEIAAESWLLLLLQE
jgi:hypothetical protein